MATSIQVGDVVRTSYGDREYTVTHVIRDCVCPEYVRSLSGDTRPSAAHDHLSCRDSESRGGYALNGYAESPDGIHSVWHPRDRLVVVDHAGTRQLELAF
ncbi:MAG: hypothetical protein WD492_12740 [Alkalispirochaeta sp.]